MTHNPSVFDEARHSAFLIRPKTGRTRAPGEFSSSFLRLETLSLFLNRGLFIKAPLFQIPQQAIKLEFLFQRAQGFFDISGLDPYFQDRPPPPPGLPPPPPRLPRPPPPPPNPDLPRSTLGRASFTVMVLSINDVPFIDEIALSPSSSDAISTKPNPLDLPFV